MANKFSGLKSISYGTTSSVGTTIAGEMTPDSTIEPTVITNDSTQSTVYGGETLAFNIGFYDFSGFAALDTIMRANTKQFIRFTFVDDSTETSTEGHPIQVQKVLQADKRTGLNTWRLMGTFSTDTSTLTSA